MKETQKPELAIDGEMQVNFALNTKLRDEKYPFTRLKGKEVNTLVFLPDEKEPKIVESGTYSFKK